MVEVRKLIPQVYNQSRDFSIFTGVLQILINELDIKSLSLLKLPVEDILPPELSTYENIRSYFRFLLKQKGSIEGVLQAISLSGGRAVNKLEDESPTYSRFYPDGKREVFTIENWDYRSVNREIFTLEKELKEKLEGEIEINRDSLVYYFNSLENRGSFKSLELIVNLKDLGSLDQGLLMKLLYYIKPVNVIIKLNEVKPII